MHRGHEWWFAYGWFYMILVWIVVLPDVIFVMKIVFGRTKKDGQPDTVLDILKRDMPAAKSAGKSMRRRKRT